MATNFKLTREKAVHDTPKHYVVQREFKAEQRKVDSIAKELKAHEKTSMAKAHPKKQLIAALIKQSGSTSYVFAQNEEDKALTLIRLSTDLFYP